MYVNPCTPMVGNRLSTPRSRHDTPLVDARGVKDILQSRMRITNSKSTTGAEGSVGFEIISDILQCQMRKDIKWQKRRHPILTTCPHYDLHTAYNQISIVRGVTLYNQKKRNDALLDLRLHRLDSQSIWVMMNSFS